MKQVDFVRKLWALNVLEMFQKFVSDSFVTILFK